MRSLDELPAALALEVDALCDDFERHWRRARRRGTPPPVLDAFVARTAPEARPVLRLCLLELESELASGVLLPCVPGLEVEEEIGRGGMGVVYRARRLADGRAVALKLIPGAEHARWSRWLAELADLRHPNLVPLEAFGAHDGLHYVVMPLIAGGDLKERLGEFVARTDSKSPRRIARLMARVAGAVEFLHGRGILHRDLKPSNILLSPVEQAGGQASEPLVCDFGLAGRLDETCPETSRPAGTPAYMAPEQRAGGPLGPAADVYALGCVLYELLTGRPPGLPAEEITGALAAICLRCLRRDPAERYASAAELAAALNPLARDT